MTNQNNPGQQNQKPGSEARSTAKVAAARSPDKAAGSGPREAEPIVKDRCPPVNRIASRIGERVKKAPAERRAFPLSVAGATRRRQGELDFNLFL